MLHIITAAYRFENLEQIYNSILINDDITWHITKSFKREDISFDFIKYDSRIKIHNVDCEDREGYKKHQYSLSKIKNGYFCILDDDTIFHENMYLKYRECMEQNFVGMLIGQQLDYDGEIRLSAHPPRHCFIDAGNVLTHHSCLSSCTYPSTHTPGENNKDFLFWESVYHFYGKKCGIWNSPISHYNKLSKEEKWKNEKKVYLMTKKK